MIRIKNVEIVLKTSAPANAAHIISYNKTCYVCCYVGFRFSYPQLQLQ